MNPNDFGIKVSQPFTDVFGAGDKDLIFSSSFPLLKEERSGIFDMSTAPTGLNTIFTHSLEYYPFFLIFSEDGDFLLGSEWQVNEDALFYKKPASPSMNDFMGRVRWVVYRLNIFQPFQANSTDVGSALPGPYNRNFGIKVAKEGKDVSSTDLRDFTIHSRGRSPLLHIVDVKQRNSSADDGSHDVDPELPYNPICFGFVQDQLNENGRAYNMISGGQATPVLRRLANGHIVIDSIFAVGSLSSIVVFKDPFIAPKHVGVSY